MAKGEEYTKAEQQWITETKDRLAQRRGKKPAAKAGQLRALRSELPQPKGKVWRRSASRSKRMQGSFSLSKA
jgi:hypothetical protein